MINYLYRYESFNSEYALKTIFYLFEKNEIYLNSRTQFNDPFDSYPYLAGEIKREDVLKHLQPRIPMSEEEKIRRLDQTDPNRDYDKFMARLLNQTGIKSFSDNYESIQLWAHYADSHRGYCIQFHPIDSELSLTNPVIYEQERPSINKLDFLVDEEKFVHQLAKYLLVKSIEWEKEREHRITLHQKAYSYIKINQDEITAIYFGCECADEYIDLIKRYTLNKNVRLFKCKKHHSEFRLIFEPLN